MNSCHVVSIPLPISKAIKGCTLLSLQPSNQGKNSGGIKRHFTDTVNSKRRIQNDESPTASEETKFTQSQNMGQPQENQWQQL